MGLVLAGLVLLIAAVVLVGRAPRGPADVGTVPAAAADGGALTKDPPTRLALPGLSISAPVAAVGVRPDGGLEIPPSQATVGWWSGGAAPGSSAGTVVFAGHVDTKAAEGALFRLTELTPGGLITVDTARGRFRYEMVARRSFAKTRLPADTFDQSVQARLVIVTCTGVFRNGSYDENLVIYARPTR